MSPASDCAFAHTSETPSGSPEAPGPRYTSYPAAERFVEAFGEAELRHALLARSRGGGATHGGSFGGSAPLAVCVQVPFCASELALHATLLGRRTALSQLQVRAGAPGFFGNGELRRLMDSLRATFSFAADAELAIDVDAGRVDADRLRHLAALGFNQIGFGVPDVDFAGQSQPSLASLMRAAADAGFVSTQLDLVYGLPLQTPESWARTVQQVAMLRPSRVLLSGCAHLPQRRAAAAPLPSAEDRRAMLAQATASFVAQGYCDLGMDHFALPDDGLAVARRQGRLHRNVQGYSAQPDGDLIGLGVAAVSRIGASYSQNAKSLPEYHDALAQGRLPVVRGVALNRDDLLRRALIMALLCQGRVDVEAIEQAYLIELPRYFASELRRLQPLIDRRLVAIEQGAIQITPLGWHEARTVAMLFDRYLQSDLARHRCAGLL